VARLWRGIMMCPPSVLGPHPVGAEVVTVSAVGDGSASGAAGLFFRGMPHQNMRRVKYRHCLSMVFLL